MSLIEIYTILIIHWIADFIMQDEKWALGKSKNWNDLTKHTMLYSMIWWFPALIAILLSQPNIKDLDELVFKGFLFILITFIAHTATDYFTSKIVSKNFEKETIFTLKVSQDVFKENAVLQHGSNKVIIMKHLSNDSKVKLYNSIPNFGAFTIVGFDQLLHYIQLFLTYYLLIKI